MWPEFIWYELSTFQIFDSRKWKAFWSGGFSKDLWIWQFWILIQTKSFLYRAHFRWAFLFSWMHTIVQHAYGSRFAIRQPWLSVSTRPDQFRKNDESSCQFRSMSENEIVFSAWYQTSSKLNFSISCRDWKLSKIDGGCWNGGCWLANLNLNVWHVLKF